jgi:hypothetical protein
MHFSRQSLPQRWLPKGQVKALPEAAGDQCSRSQARRDLSRLCHGSIRVMQEQMHKTDMVDPSFDMWSLLRPVSCQGHVFCKRQAAVWWPQGPLDCRHDVLRASRLARRMVSLVWSEIRAQRPPITICMNL